MLTTVFAWRHRLVTLSAALACAVGLTACNPYVEYKTYRENESFKKAAPFYEALGRGEIPSDEDIKAAHVGEIEPMLLTQVAFRRAIQAAVDDYETQWAGLAIGDLLDDTSLADPKIRASSRAALQAAAGWHDAFKHRIAPIFARADKDMHALIDHSIVDRQVKAKAIDNTLSDLRRYLYGLAGARAEHQRLALDLLAFLDEHAKAFALKRGVEPVLVFRDPAIEDQFNERADRINELRLRADAQDREFQDAQDHLIRRLDQAVKGSRQPH